MLQLILFIAFFRRILHMEKKQPFLHNACEISDLIFGNSSFHYVSHGDALSSFLG